MPACFAAVPNLPAGTVLSNFNPQQTNGTGSYVVGNNGVAGDSGVGSLFGGLGRNILRGTGGGALRPGAFEDLSYPQVG